MRTRSKAEGVTGLHVLFALLTFFGVVVAANVTMAFFARSSWTGLVVENSYVASQQFNGKMARTRAQSALGWQSELVIRDNVVSYELKDSEGARVPLTAVNVTFRRPIDDREDHAVSLASHSSGGFWIAHALADGAWQVEVEADTRLEFPYRETVRMQVKGGTAQ